MTQILFVQGAGEDAHDHWDDKLVHSLEQALGDGYSVRYPHMPDEGDPKYAAWKKMLREEMKGLDDGTLLIGHSVGATVLYHMLAEGDAGVKPGALILIAPPFVGEGGWPNTDMPKAGALPARLPVLIYHGSKDDTVPAAHMVLYARAIPQAVIHTLPGRDHQRDNDLSEVARDIRNLP